MDTRNQQSPPLLSSIGESQSRRDVTITALTALILLAVLVVVALL